MYVAHAAARPPEAPGPRSGHRVARRAPGTSASTASARPSPAGWSSSSASRLSCTFATALGGARSGARVAASGTVMAVLVRVLTYNLLTFDDASGRDRHPVARRVIGEADADVIALQEVRRSAEFDQAADLLGPGYTIVDLPGWSPSHVGEGLATPPPLPPGPQ